MPSDEKPVVGARPNNPVAPIPAGPLKPLSARNADVAGERAPFMSKKDMPGATAGLIAAASENGPAVANPGGNKVAPGGNSILNSRFNDVWLFKNGVIELNMLKVEPGRKMKFDPDVWTRIDPAGRTLVVDVVVPVPVVVVVVVAAVSAILEGKGPPL